MESDNHGDTVLDPSFFEGRLLVEIETWDCRLHVGLSSEAVPTKYKFQGGLNFSQGFDIAGHVRAPAQQRGKRIAVHVIPFGAELKSDEWDDVGRLYFHANRPPHKPPLTATLLIPESALPLAATCMSSIWKYIHIWTFDDDAEQASISAFSFDTKIHGNLKAWVSQGE